MTRSSPLSAMPSSSMKICGVFRLELADLHLDLPGERVELDSGPPELLLRLRDERLASSPI